MTNQWISTIEGQKRALDLQSQKLAENELLISALKAANEQKQAIFEKFTTAVTDLEIENQRLRVEVIVLRGKLNQERGEI